MAPSDSVVRIFAISGSLRRGSSNTAVLQAAAALAPPNAEVMLFDSLAAIPAFNPDDDDESPPPPVQAFRKLLSASDAVLISSPEYAHGVAGALKNALDWVVGSSELVDKPVALINASPRASIAHASLIEILSTMAAVVVPDASIALPLLGRGLGADAIAADPDLAAPLRGALSALVAAVERVKAAAD